MLTSCEFPISLQRRLHHAIMQAFSKTQKQDKHVPFDPNKNRNNYKQCLSACPVIPDLRVAEPPPAVEGCFYAQQVCKTDSQYPIAPLSIRVSEQKCM